MAKHYKLEGEVVVVSGATKNNGTNNAYNFNYYYYYHC